MKRLSCFALAVCLLLACALTSGCAKTADGGIVYDIDCRYRGGVFVIDERVSFTADEDCREFAFNFYPLSACAADGAVKITSVTVDKNKADVRTEGGAVFVSTDRYYRAGERVSVRFTATADMPSGDMRFSKNDRTVNLGNAFFTLAVKGDDGYMTIPDISYGDPFATDSASFNVKITVPSTYVVAAGAYPGSLDVGESETKYEYSTSRRRDFALCLCESYDVKSEKWGDKSINYCFYADNDPDSTLGATRKALEFFSEKFGAYPYDDYTVAETRFYAGGMEYPAMCFLSDALTETDRIYTVVHEAAHQWWYAAVGNDQINESYLDESLAEYSTYLFFDENKEYGISGEELVGNAASAANVAESAALKLDPSFVPKVRAPLTYFKSEYLYVNMVYNKGLVMMKAAENAVGRRGMISALKKYYADNAFKIAGTEDLLSVAGTAKPILRSFIDGKTRVFI